MNNILIISNDSTYTYNFRKEIIEKLIHEGYNVTVLSNFSKNIENLKRLGIRIIETKIHRRSINPIKDLLLLRNYIRYIKKIKPDIVFTFTTKPNIYGGLAARFCHIPYLPNITGLGTAVENKSFLQLITLNLYKVALRKSNTIFFQNKENMEFMLKRGIKGNNQILLPGSGVNTEYFVYLDYPDGEILNFLFIARVMKEKGIDFYLEAARYIKSKYSNVCFHVLGYCEEDYKDILDEYQSEDIIIYHGKVEDIRKYLMISHCTIHPTYYPEGMSNVLLESAASGRPVISTNRSGCKEIIENGKNGYLVETFNQLDLNDKIEKFINLSYEEKKLMGLYGRKKIVSEFNRNIVVDKYINEVRKVISKS